LQGSPTAKLASMSAMGGYPQPMPVWKAPTMGGVSVPPPFKAAPPKMTPPSGESHLPVNGKSGSAVPPPWQMMTKPGVAVDDGQPKPKGVPPPWKTTSTGGLMPSLPPPPKAGNSVGFSKAASAAVVGPGGPVMSPPPPQLPQAGLNQAGPNQAMAKGSGNPMANPTLDILRRGEELMRQTQAQQQQRELLRKKEQEEARQKELELQRQEELERRKADLERMRKEAEEKKRILEEEARRKKQEANDEAQALQTELSQLIEAAEAATQKALECSAPLDAELADEAVIMLGIEFEVLGSESAAAVKACFDFMEGKHLKLKGNTEDTMLACAGLLKRAHAAKGSAEKTVLKVRSKEKFAKDSSQAKALQVDLQLQLGAADSEVAGLKDLQASVEAAGQKAAADASSGPEAGGGDLDEDVVRLASDFETLGARAFKAVAGCSSIFDGKLQVIRGPTEELKNAAAELLRSHYKLKVAVDDSLQKVKALKAVSAQRIDREAKKLAAKKEAERQEALFKHYDTDGDGKLGAEEIKAYVAGEYKFVLAEDKLKLILSSCPEGVSWEKFPQLRSQVKVAWSEVLAKQRKERGAAQSVVIKKRAAETQSALAGVETEVAKAEVAVRFLGPLISRAAHVLDMLTDRTEEAEAAIDAAKDFLAAAKEEAGYLTKATNGKEELETEAKQLGAVEAKKLGFKLVSLETRLNQAMSVTKVARSKVDFQQKKAELLRQADAML